MSKISEALREEKSRILLTCIMYHNQRKRSKRCNYPPPSYNLEEFRRWIFSQKDFEKLYKAWIDSGCETLLVPSCDRLDDYKPYTFDNLRLVTWGENKKRGNDDAKNGVNNKHNKAVVQMNKDGEIVCIHHSIRHAERVTSAGQSCIIKCCKGLYRQSGGYGWKYLTDVPEAINNLRSKQ